MAHDHRQHLETRRCPLFGFREQAEPQGRIVAAPPQETEPGSQRTGRDITRHQGRLDRQRTGTTHRIEKLTSRRRDIRPARTEQNGGCQIFLQRRLAAVDAITAPVQAVTGQIDADRRLVAIEVHIDPQIRLRQINRRPGAMPAAEMIDNGILHLLCAKQRVGNRRTAGGKIDRQRRFGLQVNGPVDGRDTVVKCLLVRGRKPRYRHQYPIGQPRPQTGAIRRAQIADERDPGAGFGHL